MPASLPSCMLSPFPLDLVVVWAHGELDQLADPVKKMCWVRSPVEEQAEPIHHIRSKIWWRGMVESWGWEHRGSGGVSFSGYIRLNIKCNWRSLCRRNHLCFSRSRATSCSAGSESVIALWWKINIWDTITLFTGSMIWLDTSNINYSNWYNDQPSPFSSTCGYILKNAKYQWGVTENCSQEFDFICEFGKIHNSWNWEVSMPCSQLCLNCLVAFKGAAQ